MIWDYLSNVNLQKLIGDEILADLELMLPSICTDNDDQELFDINKKSTLKKIVSSFVTKSFFR